MSFMILSQGRAPDVGIVDVLRVCEAAALRRDGWMSRVFANTGDALRWPAAQGHAPKRRHARAVGAEKNRPAVGCPGEIVKHALLGREHPQAIGTDLLHGDIVAAPVAPADKRQPLAIR